MMIFFENIFPWRWNNCFIWNFDKVSKNMSCSSYKIIFLRITNLFINYLFTLCFKLFVAFNFLSVVHYYLCIKFNFLFVLLKYLFSVDEIII